MGIKKAILKEVERSLCKGLEALSTKELYTAVSNAVMVKINDVYSACLKKKEEEKTAYYLSAEFLMGRSVYSNLVNLGMEEEVAELLNEYGRDIKCFEEVEDAALGNGGLGRLAACFLDSAATLGKNLDGYGIRYRYGLFKQSFSDGFQKEEADDWTRWGDPWSRRVESEAQVVVFKTFAVRAVPYDMPIIGYGAKTVNRLRLWQAEPMENFDFARFDACDYRGAYKAREEAEKISAVLYPNDSADKGRRLRLMQEYFFTSASVGDIIDRMLEKEVPLDEFADHAVMQLNDTHPVLAVPELIRRLEEHGMDFDEAFAVAKKAFAYTNHTVMGEALEKWSVKLVKSLLPEIYAVMVRINDELKRELKARGLSEERRLIIDGGLVHMARLACYVAGAVNGVAEIHTGIIKADTLKEWYELYPEKFFNETNGITQRRWLRLANPRLSDYITRRIGDKWITELSELEKLKSFAESRQEIEKFASVKRKNKRELARFIREREGVEIDESYIFDVQIKRLHEYKRQLLNAFSIVAIYKGLKDGSIKDFKPTAFIFGAKAAPAYTRAKGIIKYINEIAKKVNADEETNDRLKVVFVSDYNVSYAEKIVAAADVSEQISAAGTEASGTGNMKLMLGGAVTLGTFDGANIEIAEEAGEENEYIFGARVEDIERIKDTYEPKKLYSSDKLLKAVVDTLDDGTFSDGGTGIFAELKSALLEGASWHKADNYYLLYDFKSYLETKLKVNADYGTDEWYRKCFMNTASAGKFSSDRTVIGYCRDIWKI